MRFSVTSWSFPELTLAEAWGVAQAIGLDAIDVGLLHGPALDRNAVLADPAAAAGAIRARGMTVSNVYWLFGDSPHERPLTDPEAHERNVADFSRVAAFAGQLAAPTVFVLPGVARARHTAAALREIAARALRAMLPIAADEGVTLTVEPHVGGILDSPASTLALLDAVPGLKLTLDYAHFVAMGFTQADVDRLAPHAAHVHLRQARPGALQAKLAEGTIDFIALVETLRQGGYGGFLALEYVHQAYMNTLFDDVLTETVRLKRLLAPSLG